MSAVPLVFVRALVLASVALGGGQSELITGLVDNQTLTEWSQYSPINQSFLNPENDDTQFFFLGSILRCNGNVTKWTVGAGFGGMNRDVHPALGIYRLINGVYARIRSIVLNHTELIGSRIYEFTLGSSRPFLTNDVLGIYLPPNNVTRLRLLSQVVTNGPRYRVSAPPDPPPGGVRNITINPLQSFLRDRLPLVAVEIESDNPESANCTSNFLSRELLELLAPPLIQPSEQQIVFPSYTFTGNGSITGWTLAGEWVSEDGRDKFPELQIWRRSNNQGGVYDRVNETELTATAESPNQLYSGTIDPPLPFQSGDVLGLYLPPDGSNGTRLLVHFGQEAGPVYEIRSIPLFGIVFNGAATNNHRPLLALEIITTSSPISTASPTNSSTSDPPPTTTAGTTGSTSLSTGSTTDTATPSSSVSSTEVTAISPSSTQPLITIIIAVVVVAVVLVLAIVATIIIIVFVVVFCSRRRVNRMKVTITAPPPSANERVFDNTIYESGEPHYEVDTSFNNELKAPFPDAVYAQPTNEAKSAISEGPQDKHFDNPLYDEPITTDTAIRELPTSGPGMQWGVYVPTEEQRQTTLPAEQGASLDESAIYSSVYSAIPQTYDVLHFFEEEDIYWAPSSEPSELYSQLAAHKYREILRKQVKVTEHLGSGQFGTVHKGEWLSPKGAVEVAVKTLKPGSDEAAKVKFLQEAAIMGQFQHRNVVKLYGVVTVGNPVMIVLDFMPNGDLREYLNKLPTPSSTDISSSTSLGKMCVQFCRQIASGMEYLSKKGFVHRDLAARNILVAADKICKIADFGMARDVEDGNYYVSQGGQIPVKWTAPEALHYKKYSTASDVWSFGVVMFEIWSLGHKPFEDHTNLEAGQLVCNRGHRLSPPPGCPKKVYTLMIQCWHPDTSGRPLFEQLRLSLSQPDSALLSWSEEDIAVHPQAAVLGAPLDAGKDLYKELQSSYRSA